MTSFFSVQRCNICFLYRFDRHPCGLQLVDMNWCASKFAFPRNFNSHTKIKSDCDATNSFATTFIDNWRFPKTVVPSKSWTLIGFPLWIIHFGVPQFMEAPIWRLAPWKWWASKLPGCRLWALCWCFRMDGGRTFHGCSRSAAFFFCDSHEG